MAENPVERPAGTPAAGVRGRACELGELLGIIAALREHCPWMGALNHASLVEYLIEEAFEVAESIETGTGDAELRGELGDVLLQVVLHARLAEERGTFTFEDVARGLSAKMVRRNPHVFRADGTLQDSFPATVTQILRNWDAVKTAERPERKGPFEGIPDALPALAKAAKFLDRAHRAGIRDAQLPAADSQVHAVVQLVEGLGTEQELGELLLAVVASARPKGFDAERALRGAIRQHYPVPS